MLESGHCHKAATAVAILTWGQLVVCLSPKLQSICSGVCIFCECMGLFTWTANQQMVLSHLAPIHAYLVYLNLCSSIIGNNLRHVQYGIISVVALTLPFICVWLAYGAAAVASCLYSH